MTDGYQQFSHSFLGNKICKLFGLPIPAKLKRLALHSGQPSSGQSEAEPNEQVNNILVSTSLNSALVALIQDNFASSEVTFSQSAESVLSTDNWVLKDLIFDGLVFDARDIKSAEQLESLYHFFNQHLSRLTASGKIVLLGLNPEQLTNCQHATAQYSLQGFIKSLAKEVGRKGITVNLLMLENSPAQDENLVGLVSPLQFFLSYASAYVNGQVLKVNNATIELESSAQVTPQSTAQVAKPLQGKVALVTGAAQGIGAAIAEKLAADGAQVIGLDIAPMEQVLKQSLAKINGLPLLVDVSKADAAEQISAFIKAEVSQVDIVVHNAGITRDKMLKTMPLGLWKQVLNINLSSIERINAQLFNEQLINSGGRIVCLSSISGIAGNVGQTNYATSKAGVIGLVQSTAKTLGEQNITINGVAPGFIETKMTGKIPFLTRQIGRRMSSLSQGGTPDDVAQTIAFLAAPQSFAINGNVLRVCGQNMLGA